MKRKNELIVEYSKQLDYKDQLYVDSLKKFKNDIEDMLILMKDQFLTLREQMLNHLDLTEAKFTEDRKRYIDEYKRGVDNFRFELERVQSDKEDKLTSLEDTLEDAAKKEAYKAEMELINKVILMEKNADFLKETIEDFTYEVKILSERLDYRVEVRNEKIKENMEKKTQFEKWDARLGEKIRESYQLYKDKDLENRIENNILKDELMKMTDSFEKLKEKFQHFEKYDDFRFQDIYDMKKKEAKELAIKVAMAERTIMTQQLGMEYKEPENPEGFSLAELQKEQENEDANFEEKDSLPHSDDNRTKNMLGAISSERVRQVFSYIISEAEFLIEMNVIIKCADLSEEERLPLYIESICKALNIKNENELNSLLQLFDSHNEAENKIVEIKITEDSNNDSGEEVIMKEKVENNLKINPDKVLKLLEDFYNMKIKQSKEQSKLFFLI
jgi:hypothetical protein